jgi:O-antigen ligase
MLIVMLIFVKKNINHSLAIGAVLLSVCILGVFLYKPLWDKITTTNSLVARFYLWEGAFDYFKAHPLFGIGPNHYSYLHPAGSPTAGGINIDAHSIYMNTLAQTGLAGFVSLILLMYGFIREFFEARTINGFGTSLKYCALGAFFVTFASGFFDSTFHHSHGILFSLLLGLFAGNTREMLPGQKPESPDN